MRRAGNIVALATVLWLASPSAQARDCPNPWNWSGACDCPQPRRKPAPPPTTGVTYPICFYDVELGAVETARATWPEYAKKLEAVLSARVPNRKKFTVVSSRSAVVWTTTYAHRQLARIWPDVACVGRSGGGTTEEQRKRCVRFVAMTLKSRLEKAPAPGEAEEPVCQTFLATP
jgi:hypothetical protein